MRHLGILKAGIWFFKGGGVPHVKNEEHVTMQSLGLCIVPQCIVCAGLRALYRSTVHSLKTERLNEGTVNLARTEIMSAVIIIGLVTQVLSFKSF